MSALAITLLLLAANAAPENVQGVLLGVLEQPQCREGHAAAIRPLFIRTTNGWVALSDPGATEGVRFDALSWIVAFDGRSLGAISSVDAGGPRGRLLGISPGTPPPVISNTNTRFAGWCGVPSQRPLVVVSRPNFRDPEAWTLFQPASDLRDVLFDAFKAQAGSATVCRPGADTPVAFPYGSKDLLFSRSYQDRNGRKLVAVGLDPRLDSCNGPNEPAWATHWFLLHDGVRYLGAGLSLVDAGDYDGDGVSELLFWYSGYNSDGYVLLYDRFRKRAELGWSYH